MSQPSEALLVRLAVLAIQEGEVDLLPAHCRESIRAKVASILSSLALACIVGAAHAELPQGDVVARSAGPALARPRTIIGARSLQRDMRATLYGSRAAPIV